MFQLSTKKSFSFPFCFSFFFGYDSPSFFLLTVQFRATHLGNIHRLRHINWEPCLRRRRSSGSGKELLLKVIITKHSEYSEILN